MGIELKEIFHKSRPQIRVKGALTTLVILLHLSNYESILSLQLGTINPRAYTTASNSF